MSRVLLCLLLAAAVAFVIALRIHRSERFRATREASVANPADPPPQLPPAPEPPPPVPIPCDRPSGLWLLAADDAARVAKPAAPHPWAEYMRKRNATRALWRATKLDVKFDNTPFAGLPAYFSPAGLTLRIDPAVAAIDRSFIYSFHQQTGEEILRLTTACDPVRMAYGADGVLWLAPRDGPAAAEPAFLEELREWDFAARKMLVPPGPPIDAPCEKLRATLAEKHSVQIIRLPLWEALGKLQQTFGVSFSQEVNVFDLEDEPAQIPVSVVRDEATLEEVLKELLETQDLVAVPQGDSIHIIPKADWERDAAAAAALEDAAKHGALGAEEIRTRLVHLDGTPLSAGDLATAAAAQLGLRVKLDPLLGEVPARWQAVDADLKLGEVLDAIAAGAKCRCELHPDAWPRSDAISAGWTLWVVTEKAVAK
ncbi:MAG: hypothetical protein K8T20_08210 [Planctomycetes bacterium]|nr:hypothetical protein [Planctomycetota bacterium]